MIRKTLIAIAAAATLALGMSAATVPAEAKVNIYIGTPHGGYYHRPYYRPYYQPYYHSYHRRAPYHCHKKKVYYHGYWKKVKRCHRAWH